MINLEFDSDIMFSHHWCGKFESPSDEWMHLTRNLIDFELMVVTQGTLYIADHQKEYVINKGEYILMPPTSNQHGYKKGGCSFYWLHFWYNKEYNLISNDEFTFNSEKTYVPIIDKLTSSERVIILMKQLQDSDKRYHNASLNNSITTSILTEISCQNALYKKFYQPKQTKQVFNDIMDYVQYHSSENIKVSDIADYFNYNPKYLSTFFKNQSGVSLKQYMLQVKMDSAKAELSDTNHSISQIAYNVGFNDAHNFTNAFRKITGLSPSEYRQSYGKRALFYS